MIAIMVHTKRIYVQSKMIASIIRAILVLSSTYYLKVVLSLNLCGSTRWIVGGEPCQALERSDTLLTIMETTQNKPSFKGSTLGYEDVVFVYRKSMKQGDWKSNLQSLSEIAASTTKYGRA